MTSQLDTICAIATPPGVGAIAVIRLSGKKSIDIANMIFRGRDLHTVDTHTLHFGLIQESELTIDEVLVSIFRGKQSYTGEDTVEISVHGSSYIQKRVLGILVKKGARLAEPGEFTLRAFLNGKLDLSQAEAVMDVISAESKPSHQLAIQQMRGGFSKKILQLKDKLVHFASLIELELDFGEEDVEFANRKDLKKLIEELNDILTPLIESFSYGNVIKEGVPVAIVGKPNAGKSTLLNALLNEDRAIVSDIAGTTRDTIEECMTIKGIQFRFIDTAGLRETNDEIEKAGVLRTMEQIEKSTLYIYLFDVMNSSLEDMKRDLETMKKDTPKLIVANKMDRMENSNLRDYESLGHRIICISAKDHVGLDKLKDQLYHTTMEKVGRVSDTTITNVRHLDCLMKTKESLDKVLQGLDVAITGDFLAMDIRQGLHYLGEITGEITTDDLLDNIFSKFCIGK